MKKRTVLALVVTASIVLVTSTAVFAGHGGEFLANRFGKKLQNIDPVKSLEDKKANIQKKLTDGKITKEAADKEFAEIDKKIKELQDFNSLTAQQKKDKLLSDFTTQINKQVTDGKLTREKADKMIADFKTKLENWDGTGYPFGFGKKDLDVKEFKGKMQKTKGDPIQVLENQKANIQKKLTDGKITKDAADKAIAEIDKKIKELQDFNSLTTQQKKDKLLNDFTAEINKQVANGKLTREKADQCIANYKAKLEKWDGTGYPFALEKGFRGGKLANNIKPFMNGEKRFGCKGNLKAGEKRT